MKNGPRPLTPIEKVCTVFAWIVCVWLVLVGAYRLFTVLGEGHTPDFIPFTGMALGFIGIFLMVCLADERKWRG